MCMQANMKDLNVECMEHLGVPKGMGTRSIFVWESHNKAFGTWLHDILSVADIIGSIVNVQDSRLNGLVQTTNDLEIIVLIISERMFISIIFITM